MVVAATLQKQRDAKSAESVVLRPLELCCVATGLLVVYAPQSANSSDAKSYDVNYPFTVGQHKVMLPSAPTSPHGCSTVLVYPTNFRRRYSAINAYHGGVNSLALVSRVLFRKV